MPAETATILREDLRLKIQAGLQASDSVRKLRKVSGDSLVVSHQQSRLSEIKASVGSLCALMCFVCLSCVAQWKSFQEARQTVIELMNEAEKKLTEFSTAKAATSQEAEDKLGSHRVRKAKTKSVSFLMKCSWFFYNFGSLLFLFKFFSPSCRL